MRLLKSKGKKLKKKWNKGSKNFKKLRLSSSRRKLK
jgi:hypothetical protein